MNRILLAISLLAVVGMVLSAVSLKNHYSGEKTEYCDLSENFNCDLVNRSVYSRVGPVPVAAIGLIGYGVLFALARMQRRAARALMLLASLVGLAFCLYLTYIEAYVLAVWCLLCLGSLGTMLGITVLAAVAVVKRSPSPAA